eukprot:jgi/Mesvir1/20592/Mv14828-RA.3
MMFNSVLSDEESAAILSWCGALRLHDQLPPQRVIETDVVTQLYDVMQSLSPTIFPPRTVPVDGLRLKDGVESFLVEVLGIPLDPAIFQARNSTRDLAGLVLFASMNGFTMSVKYIKAVLSLDKRHQAVLQYLMEPVQAWLNPPPELPPGPCPVVAHPASPLPEAYPIANTKETTRLREGIPSIPKDTTTKDTVTKDIVQKSRVTPPPGSPSWGGAAATDTRAMDNLTIDTLVRDTVAREAMRSPCRRCQQYMDQMSRLEGEHKALVEAHRVSSAREAESARAARAAVAAQAESANALQAMVDARREDEHRMAGLERKAGTAEALRDRVRFLTDELDVAHQERDRAKSFERTAQQYRERLETALQAAQTAEDLEKQNQAYVLRIMELEDEAERIPLLAARVKEQDAEILELERSLRDTRAQCQQNQLKEVEREREAHELTRADLSKARMRADELAESLEASQDEVAALTALITSLQGGDDGEPEDGDKKAPEFGGSLGLPSPGKENGGDFANMDARVTVRGGKGARSKLLPLNLLLATDIQERLQRLEKWKTSTPR